MRLNIARHSLNILESSAAVNCCLQKRVMDRSALVINTGSGYVLVKKGVFKDVPIDEPVLSWNEKYNGINGRIDP